MIGRTKKPPSNWSLAPITAEMNNAITLNAYKLH